MGVQLRRYVLPSVKGDGWAVIVLGSDGFFAAVSAHGNYAHLWSHHGCADAREFFARADRDWDYFVNKLSPRPWTLDGEKTHQRIAQFILTARRHDDFSARLAREEWQLLQASDIRDTGEAGFADWHRQTKIWDAAEYAVYSPPSDVVAFCRQTLPRWAAMLQAELAAEAAECARAAQAG